MIKTERGFPPNIAEVQVFPDRPAFSRLARFSKYDDWGVDLSGRRKIGQKFTLKGKLFYHEHEDDYVFYPDIEYADQIAVSTYQDYFLGATLIGELELLPAHALFFSLHYKGDSHKEKDDGYLPFTEAFSYTYSYGLEYRYQPGLGLNVTAGVSYDLLDVTEAQANETDRNTGDLVAQTDLETPDIKSELNPMLGLSYNFADSTRLFASIAKKTRFPTLQHLFSSRSGNPDLHAENSTNYTLGLSRSFGKAFDIEAAGFYHNISEWIMRPDRDSNYGNVGHILICGLEIAARAHVTDNLTFTLDYNYNQAADDSEGRVTDNVLGVPEHKVGLGVSWFNPDILTRLDIRGIYEGCVYYQLPTADNPDDEALMTKSRFLVGARISKEFLSHFEAYLAVNNIFDTDYESENNYPGPGRNCLLGVTARY
ncbi:MAG: TonB-dependent receptor [Thermodesulfobacteriota bacterium]|nr:TonB-dependent receptor [Thermodesulfobacteriota bacterium]